MKKSLKRILTLVLSMLMVMSCLAGCDLGLDDSSLGAYPYSGDQLGGYTPQETLRVPGSDGNLPTLPGRDPVDTNDPANDSTTQTPTPSGPSASSTLTVDAGETLSYVMIYNPAIYTDDRNTQTRQTGNIANQVNVDMNRGDELPEEPEYLPFEQPALDPEFLSKLNLEGGKADGLGKYYKVGDKETFYCSSGDINSRTAKQFTCAYAGTHANIWVYENLNQSDLDSLGRSFDNTVYAKCVEMFGTARFGETVNFLVYNFAGNPNTVGFFHPYDLYSTNECSDTEARQYGINRDINVLHLNSYWFRSIDTLTSTLAHEFQHLLCFTGYFTKLNVCDVWFNEAMSGYIEEVLYPGSKQSSVNSFLKSDRVRNGQSLYNFGVDTASRNLDIGVYGSVYLFSEYLKNVAGSNVFSTFHKNWRNTYTQTTTAKGIYNAVPASARQEIDSLVTYPDSYRFSSAEEAWMSKLTLSFYLSTFTADNDAASRYRNIDLNSLLYDSMAKAKIEGGGRIVIAVKDGTFQIPQDADTGLVYVGLNEDMEIVTNIACS